MKEAHKKTLMLNFVIIIIIIIIVYCSLFLGHPVDKLISFTGGALWKAHSFSISTKHLILMYKRFFNFATFKSQLSMIEWRNNCTPERKWPVVKLCASHDLSEAVRQVIRPGGVQRCVVKLLWPAISGPFRHLSSNV